MLMNEAKGQTEGNRQVSEGAVVRGCGSGLCGCWSRSRHERMVGRVGRWRRVMTFDDGRSSTAQHIRSETTQYDPSSRPTRLTRTHPPSARAPVDRGAFRVPCSHRRRRPRGGARWDGSDGAWHGGRGRGRDEVGSEGGGRGDGVPRRRRITPLKPAQHRHEQELNGRQLEEAGAARFIFRGKRTKKPRNAAPAVRRVRLAGGRSASGYIVHRRHRGRMLVRRFMSVRGK